MAGKLSSLTAPVERMIVDDADRLHPRIGDGRPGKFETAPLEFLGDLSPAYRRLIYQRAMNDGLLCW